MAEEDLKQEDLSAGDEPTQEEINEAKEMGWSDKADWKGPEEAWVDARTYLKKGREIMPLLRNNNRRLLEEVRTLKETAAAQASALKAATASIKALEEANAEDVAEQVKAAKEKLIAEIAAANRDGEHESAAELTAKLVDLNAANKAAGGKEEKGVVEEPVIAPQLAAAYKEWAGQNAAFTSDPVRVAMAAAIGEQMRNAGDKSPIGEFLDKVRDEVEKRLGGGKSGGAGKAMGGNGGGGRGGGGGNGSTKTYADLPADAKAACERQAARLVGENRKHKTIDSWRKSYTQQYFSGE